MLNKKGEIIMNKYIVFEIIKKGTPFAFQEILENKIAYKELSEKLNLINVLRRH